MISKEVHERKTRKRSDYPFHQIYRTRWADNDMYAHVNNAVYAMYFDAIVNTWLIKECGMNPFNDKSRVPNQAQQVGIMASSYCDYFSSVSFPDVLELGLRVAKLGSTSVTYEVGVFREGEEDVKVVGGYTHVFCSRETMRPAKEGMEPRVRQGLEKLIVSEKRSKL